MKVKTKFKETEIGKIPEDWEVKKLNELFQIFAGGDLRKISFSKNKSKDYKYPIYSNSLNNKGLYGFSKTYQYEPECITITARGDVGRAECRKEFFNAIVRLLVLKPKCNVSCYFVASFINSKLDFSHVGSAVNQLTAPAISDRIIAIPSIQEQSAIAKILSSLDDKIELLQKQNKTLEAIGQALYKHWFVDFEFPDEEGRPYKSSGGEMVYSKKLEKEIPKGWEINTAINLFKLEYGWHLPEWDRKIGNIPVFGSGGLSGFHNKYFVEGPGVILGRAGKIGADSTYYSHVNFCPLETTFYVSTTDKKLIRYLYFFIKTMNMTNTGSSVPNLSRSSIHNAEIIIPHRKIINQFDDVVKPLFELIHRNQEQAKTLSKTRDLLLPKLMSGKIRVPMEVKS